MEPIDADAAEIKGVLDWWKRHEQRLPKLAQLAKKYLAVPATTGSVERLFSTAGAVGRARRSRLTAKSLKELILYSEATKQK